VCKLRAPAPHPWLSKRKLCEVRSRPPLDDRYRPAATGSIRTESNLRGVIGSVTLQDAAAYPLDLEPARYWLIPYASNGGELTTTLLVQNTTAGPTTAQVRMLRADGSVSGSAWVQLAANDSRADLPRTLIQPSRESRATG